MSEAAEEARFPASYIHVPGGITVLVMLHPTPPLRIHVGASSRSPDGSGVEAGFNVSPATAAELAAALIAAAKAAGWVDPGEEVAPCTRQEHLAWCRARALDYLDDGDLQRAVASMLSDMGKHPGTSPDVARQDVALEGLAGLLDPDATAFRRWIEGFN